MLSGPSPVLSTLNCKLLIQSWGWAKHLSYEVQGCRDGKEWDVELFLQHP